MEFAQTKARLLSRTLSETIQSLQDHNASFFMITQMSAKAVSADIGELHNLVRTLDVLASSIVGNLSKVITTLDSLVSLTPSFVQGSSRNSSSTLTPSLTRPDSPTLSDNHRPSTASSQDSRHKRTFATDTTDKRRPSTGSRPSTSGSAGSHSDGRRPSAGSATTISSPLSSRVISQDEVSTDPHLVHEEEIVDMVSALIPQLSIRTSLDSDLDVTGSSRSNLFPSLPSLDFSDDLLSPEEDILEVITPPSASTSALVTGTPRVRVPTPRHALGPRLQAELAHSASSLNVADSTFHPFILNHERH